MRKKILVLIIAFILFVPYINVSASSSANTIAELRKEIAALKAKKKAQSSAKSQTQSQINATTNSLNKESYLDNGNASLDLTEGNLTGVNSSDGNGITESDMSGENEQLTELISKGNIGVTSSAELLKQWRQVLINIDEMIIEECRDLFMMIY